SSGRSVCAQHVANALGRMPAAIERGPLARRWLALEGGEGRLAVEIDEHVPALLHGLHPLGGVAQGDAWRTEQVGLLLHATRVRKNRPRVASQREEVEIPERR